MTSETLTDRAVEIITAVRALASRGARWSRSDMLKGRSGADYKLTVAAMDALVEEGVLAPGPMLQIVG